MGRFRDVYVHQWNLRSRWTFSSLMLVKVLRCLSAQETELKKSTIETKKAPASDVIEQRHL